MAGTFPGAGGLRLATDHFNWKTPNVLVQRRGTYLDPLTSAGDFSEVKDRFEYQIYRYTKDRS